MPAETQRRRARELALKALYALAMGGGEIEEIQQRVIVDDGLGARHIEFARSLFELAHRHAAWADETIASLAENWDLNRIARIDRTILTMAMVELREMPDVPEKVVLNEAIELAKKYSTEDSAAFINGILDRFVKNMPERPAS